MSFNYSISVGLIHSNNLVGLDNAEEILKEKLFKDPSQLEYWVELEKIKKFQHEFFGGKNAQSELSFLKVLAERFPQLYYAQVFLGSRMHACSQSIEKNECRESVLKLAKAHFICANQIQPSGKINKNLKEIEHELALIQSEIKRDTEIQKLTSHLQLKMLRPKKMDLKFILN